MSPGLFNVYMDAVMKELEIRMGRRVESGDCVASCIQITWFYMASQRKT